VVTHAGSNTVLEALMQGKPMIALPMVLDQPAIAARLSSVGAAEVLSAQNRSVEDIRAALTKVRRDARYRNAAQELQTRICSLRGLEHAADIIERKLTAHGFGASALTKQELPSADKQGQLR
jgi:UDP:flavonoid glycosyltransferase YjiC (YdhE family)